jgi:anti-anti-sigma factor
MSIALTINREQTDQTPRLIVAGELDIDTSDQLRIEVDHALRLDGPGLHLDLTGVKFIDSMGIKCLLHAALIGQERHKPVTFENSPEVQRIVDVLGLRDRLPDGSKPE